MSTSHIRHGSVERYHARVFSEVPGTKFAAALEITRRIEEGQP